MEHRNAAVRRQPRRSGRLSPLLSVLSVVLMFWLLVVDWVAGAEVSKSNPLVLPLVVLNPHSGRCERVGDRRR
jgi:hypothetical protein